MVHATGQDLLVDRLVLATNEVTVKVDVQVVEAVAQREGHVGVDVVNVEGVRRHLQVGGAQGLGAVRQGMHQQVLAHLEVAHIVPGKDLAHRHHMAVIDDVLGIVLNVLVDIVGDDQIDLLVHLDKATQLGEKGPQGLGVRPVVRVDVLEVHAVGVGHGLHDGHAVPAVLLVDSLDVVGVLGLPLIGLGGRVVLDAAIVHNNDLHVIGVVGTLQDGRDALVHVLGRVIARNAKGDGLSCHWLSFK